MDIRFGTDGWRDLIGGGFTETNVARVAGAHAGDLVARGGGLAVVGFDTRFGASRFARVAAETLARHGLDVRLADAFVPTPVLSFAVRDLGAAGGAMLSASHNPPEYGGYKLKGPYGGSATPDLVRAVEARLGEPDAPDGPPGAVEAFDRRDAYYAALDGLLDLPTLRSYRGEFLHDAMGGAGAGWIEGYARHAALPLRFVAVRGEPRTDFYGVNPEPVPQNLAALAEALSGRPRGVFGAVTDGDADRVGAFTGVGYFNSHKILAVLLRHLHRRGGRGRVVKTVSTSTIVDRLAVHLGLEVIETPVGFKYITDAFLEGERDASRRVLIGGEESGGIAVQGHVPERDGLLNSLLLLESVAATGQGLDEQFAEIEALTGWRHFYDRRDLHFPPGFDAAGAVRSAEGWREVAGRAVTGAVTKDGVKLLLDGGPWVMLRPSGTEPLVRVYAETNDAEALQAVLDEATRRISGA